MKSVMEHPEEIEESLFEAPPIAEQERMVEAILFASVEPVTVRELEARMPHGCDPAEALVHLRKRYEGRGVQVMKVGDSYAIRTAADLGFLMQKETVEQRKLRRAAIETLAIIAYHQPVTRAEIEEIRGVSGSRGTVDQLLEMEWIRFGRRKMTPGRPVTFVVTQHFLDHFDCVGFDFGEPPYFRRHGAQCFRQGLHLGWRDLRFRSASETGFLPSAERPKL